VLRGDNEPITVGDGSNVQDGCVLHTTPAFRW
jgi:carbonic anhydrase/acetyltransferase-like protein (isoleucine patch superfamily)